MTTRRASELSMQERIGQLLMVGFHGTSPQDEGVRTVIAQAKDGLIGGVALYRYNIEGHQQLRELLTAIRNAPTPLPLFISVDQEGGRVQRLHAKNGFQDFASAKTVAQWNDPTAVRAHYTEMASVLHGLGINFDCAPCVDLDGTPPCPVIGGMERSYADSPTVVAACAEQFIDTFRSAGIIACVKHYPGHGRAIGDSHTGLIDITQSWTEEELEPYRILQSRGKLDAIMTAHLCHQRIDAGVPCTFSPTWIRTLREQIGFSGVIVTDDLHMGAVLHAHTLSDNVVRAIAAGHDLLFFSNNPLASQARGVRHDERASTSRSTQSPAESSVPDSSLPTKVQEIVTRGLRDGQIQEQHITAAVDRIGALKQRLSVCRR